MTTPLTVLSYNVHAGLGMDGRYDLQRVADVVSRSDADLVGLQEVDRNRRATSAFDDQPARLADALGMDVEYAVTVEQPPTEASDDRPREYGIALLSRHPIRETTTHLLTQHEGSEQRALQVARVDVDGTDLAFCNTHFGLAEALRADQTADVLSAAEDLASPVVLVGDLNATPGSGPIERLTERFVDAVAEGDAEGPTFPTPYVATGEENYVEAGDGNYHQVYVPDRRLDHVLATADVGVERAERVASLASDHWAVRAELTLP